MRMRRKLAPAFNMSDMDSVIEALTKLKVFELDSEWVKESWEKDFIDVDPLPLATEDDVADEDCHRSNLCTILRLLSPWVKGKEDTGFWALLVDNDVPHRNLISMLSYLLDCGQKRVASGPQKEAGILAAVTYFSLLRIPGSNAFRVFHLMLFEKAANCLMSWTQLDAPPRKRKQPAPPAVQGGRQSKVRKRTRMTSADSLTQDDPFSEDAPEEEVGELSSQEVAAIDRALRKLLKCYVGLLGSYSLKDKDQATTHSIQTLCELAKIDPETFNSRFEMRDVRCVNSVPELAYMGLSYLCSVSHGDVPSIVLQVFRHLMPNLLMLIGDRKAVATATIPRPMLLIKEQGCAFVLHLMELYGTSILPNVRILLQHMCTKVPSKAEYRTRVSTGIANILTKLPVLHYAKMIEWIAKLSRNDKIGHRVFVLDLVGLLLAEPPHQADDTVPAEYVGLLSHQFLIQLVVARCSDIAPVVRARAIQGFASCSASNMPLLKAALKEMMTPIVRLRPVVTRIIPTPDQPRTIALTGESADKPTEVTAVEAEDKDQTIAIPATANNEVNITVVATGNPQQNASLETPTCAANVGVTPGGIILTPGGEISLADGKGIMSMLHRRAMDEKVNVRKSAIQALESLIGLDGDLLNSKDLEVLTDRCRDPGLSVRKQSMQSLTDLLMALPGNASLHRAWLDGVLPMVLDRETSAQEKCFEVLEDIFINKVVPFQRSKAAHHKMVWSLLSFLASNNGVDLRRYLQKACQHWGRTAKLKPSLLGYLQTHIDTQNNQGAWLYLSQLAQFMPRFSAGFVVDYWENTARELPDSESNTVIRVLVVLGRTAKNIPTAQAGHIAEELKERLMKFDSPTELVSVMISTLSKLCRAEGVNIDNGKTKTDGLLEDLMKASVSYLSSVILDENNDDPVDEDTLICHLFTLGEVAQLIPSETSDRVLMLVQSIIATPVINLDKSQLSQTPLSQFRGSTMSSRVRAHAFITLGKLCLQNEGLAKKCVPAMVRELEVAADPAIRNNVVVIMSDLCVRYTSLVECYIPNITTMLRDDCYLVRRQTLTVLTKLLQEDFLKWKGSLFFRFIITLVDNNKDMQEFAEFCLVHLLLQRYPAMFFHHFVECIFHFNSYDGHKLYNKFKQSDSEKQKFSLKGKVNAEKRQTIYLFLLTHLSDEQRFQLAPKLCQEILAAVVDGLLPLDVDTSAILKDTLFVLASKKIKLQMMRTVANEDEIVEVQEMAAAVMHAAKKTLISQVMKRNVIENIVPIVIALKHMLEKEHSPVLRDLMIYIRELMADYKNEIKDILAADRQLAIEIEFDLRKFEEKQAEEEEQRRSQKERGSNPVTPTGSPVNSREAAVALPRTPRLNSPPDEQQGPRGSPKQPSTPADKQKDAKNRPVPMATMAIINSARTALEKMKHVGWVDGPSDSSLKESNGDPMKTPPRNRQQRVLGPQRDRAISTPASNMSVFADITFHQSDLSLIPGTPSENSDRGGSNLGNSHKNRPRDVIHMMSPDQPRPKPRPRSPVGDPRDVIHMMSPDQPRPKPRTWNIKSPSVPMKPSRMLGYGSEEEVFGSGAGSTAAKTATRKGKKSESDVFRPRRSTRRSQPLPSPARDNEEENETFVSLSSSRTTRRR